MSTQLGLLEWRAPVRVRAWAEASVRFHVEVTPGDERGLEAMVDALNLAESLVPVLQVHRWPKLVAGRWVFHATLWGSVGDDALARAVKLVNFAAGGA